jgi:hypothetical protein
MKNLTESTKKIMLDTFKKYKIICNNSLYGGDCYGETFCPQKCGHEDFKCLNCDILFCGCCHDFNSYLCPGCEGDPEKINKKCCDCNRLVSIRTHDEKEHQCIKCNKLICLNCLAYIKCDYKYKITNCSDIICFTCGKK